MLGQIKRRLRRAFKLIAVAPYVDWRRDKNQLRGGYQDVIGGAAKRRCASLRIGGLAAGCKGGLCVCSPAASGVAMRARRSQFIAAKQVHSHSCQSSFLSVSRDAWNPTRNGIKRRRRLRPCAPRSMHAPRQTVSVRTRTGTVARLRGLCWNDWRWRE
jgi:hypothetical protein